MIVIMQKCDIKGCLAFGLSAGAYIGTGLD
jgi:hypothetical protein